MPRTPRSCSISSRPGPRPSKRSASGRKPPRERRRLDRLRRARRPVLDGRPHEADQVQGTARENPQMTWATDFSPGVLKLIGVAEVAGAIGVILPGALDMATFLVPAAAIGLVLLMVGAAITHARRHELPNVAINVAL